MTGIPTSQGPSQQPPPGATGFFGSLSLVVTALQEITQAIYKLYQAISTSAIGGVVGGDLSGTLPNPTVAQASGVFTTKASRVRKTRTVTAAGAVTISATTDDIVVIDPTVPAAVTANLPALPTAGLEFTIKGGGNTAAFPITVTPAAGTIDGAATALINSDYAAVTVNYGGASWGVVSRF